MPAIPRANRRMNDAMRKERAGLEDYMYMGGEPEVGPEEAGDTLGDTPPDAAVIAIDSAPEEASEAPLTVLEPGEEDPPEMYVYAQGETPGTWTMYPPGVPCDTGTVRVALDHPATADDIARMNEELGEGEIGAPAPAAEEMY